MSGDKWITFPSNTMDVANKYNREQNEATEERIQYVLKLRARQAKQFLV